MKYQFGTKSILLATAAVAIACGGIGLFAPIAYPNYHRFFAIDSFLLDIIHESPIWVPLVFAAFAIGRKGLSTTMVLAFALAEAFALAVAKISLFLTRGF